MKRYTWTQVRENSVLWRAYTRALDLKLYGLIRVRGDQLVNGRRLPGWATLFWFEELGEWVIC